MSSSHRVDVARVSRIVSGGQTGVDRAALDAAIAHGVAYGGWCPARGWAEDFPDPPGLLAAYPALTEATTDDPAERTVLNVHDSDATLVVRAPAVRSAGTDLTVRAAERLGRPWLETHGDAGAVLDWLASLGDRLVLNVAGPRESEEAGAYERARRLLGEVLGEVLG